MADSAGGGKRAAFFDVDGTLADTTIVHYFAHFMVRRLSPLRAKFWYAGFLARCAYYIVLDKIDRGRFNRVFYRNYAGIPAAEIKAMADECHERVMLPRSFPHAFDCIAAHRRAGDLVVLVTGSLDFIVAPLASEIAADRVLAPSLAEADGRFTGWLTGPPIGAEEKAHRMRQLAAAEGIDFAHSHAYSDSITDLPMLELVGQPHAVNPDRKLAAVAASRGWPVHRWSCRNSTSLNGR